MWIMTDSENVRVWWSVVVLEYTKSGDESQAAERFRPGGRWWRWAVGSNHQACGVKAFLWNRGIRRVSPAHRAHRRPSNAG